MKIINTRLLVTTISLSTFALGLVNLISVLNYPFVSDIESIQKIINTELVSFSRFATLLIGLLLVVTSVNIYKRKKRALHIVILLSFLSAVFHLTKGVDIIEMILSILLLVIMYKARNFFTVKSATPEFGSLIFRIGLMVSFALVYSILGFWMLDKNQFGINFNIYDSVKKTFNYLIFIGDADLDPRTRYSRWFLDSLSLISFTTITYLILSVFRPVVYIFSTLPSERKLAENILEKYAKSSQDYFKLWPDKSYYFSKDKTCFIAYGVALNYAITLSDPVGPENELADLISEFAAYCKDNDWKLIFHQVLTEYLFLYEDLGFRKLKIGDDAIVDLTRFSMQGGQASEYRYIINKLEKLGIRFIEYEPPISDKIIKELKKVSDAWLKISRRKERKFTLGMFEYDYIRSSTIFTAEDNNNNVLAFVTLVKTYYSGETTIDIMRRRKDSPNGVMDYLFIKLFLRQQEKGFEKFNIGMAPLSGYIDEGESINIEVKTVHFIIKKLNFIFSFEGLKNFKAKYASYWIPRYVIYKNPMDLPGYVLALAKLSSVSSDELNKS